MSFFVYSVALEKQQSESKQIQTSKYKLFLSKMVQLINTALRVRFVLLTSLDNYLPKQFKAPEQYREISWFNKRFNNFKNADRN